jgi:CrcB protein
MSVGLLVAVAVGAGLGSVARYALSLRAHRDHFPWPTIVVNTVGTALLGIAIAVVAQGRLGYASFAIIGLGVAGGLTTFSTLALDAVRLARTWHVRAAAVYLVLTLILGLGASYVAWTATTAVLT